MIDVNPNHLETIKRILAGHAPECEVRAFGSRVTWTAKDYSDLDLAVVASHELKPDVRRRLKEAFEESDLPFRVDVIDWHAISKSFRKVIEKQYEVVQRGARRVVGVGGEWRASTWGDEISLEYGKALRGHDTSTGQYRVFGSNGPIGWTSKALAPGPGVILGRKGAYRGVQFSHEPFFVIDTAYFIAPKSDLDMRWLYCAVKHYKLGEVDDGSPIPSTTRAAVYMLDVDVPPLPEQRAIAHILGTLDDKIELNRRMNETLEAMARALFKSWFVDFDPVRAKAEGRDPGLPRPLADLFPAHLVDSELGEIPEGWEVKKLGQLMELAYGKALKAENRREGSVPVYGSNGQVGWHDERLVAGPGIVVGRKGNPGIATWVPTDFYSIDTTFYVVPGSDCHSLQFLFQVLRTHDLASLGADSAVPGLNRNLAYMSDQVLPPASLLAQFEFRASALSRRVSCGNDESRTLTALRDTLLPKLISGELRVKDPEKLRVE